MTMTTEKPLMIADAGLFDDACDLRFLGINSIFLAGANPNGKDHWREKIVFHCHHGLCSYLCKIDDETFECHTEEMSDLHLWSPNKGAILTYYDYTGPYFNCPEHTHTHKVSYTEQTKLAIANSDLVYLYLDRPNLYEGIAQIAYAHALGKKTLTGIKSNSSIGEFGGGLTAYDFSDYVCFSDYSDPDSVFQETLGTYYRLKSPKTTGLVYLLGSEQGGYYKIGKTSNLHARIKYFEIQLPFKVELLHTIKSNDHHKAEAYFHDLHRDKRANGEWFSLTPEDVAHFQTFSRLDF